MDFLTITDFEQIPENTWNQVLKNNKIDSPFLRYGFQRTWWSLLGGGEWKNADLQIITAKENGEIIGIAPLFITNLDGKKQVHLIGSFEISDYLDFVVPAENSYDFIKNVFRMIFGNPKDSADEIILFNIPENSPTITSLQKLEKEGGWIIQTEKAYHTPSISLPDDWDTYLANIDKKQRHEIRRKIRRAENSEEDEIGWHIIKSDNDLEQAIFDFFKLMENDPDKARFLTANMRKQMEAIIRWADQEEILQLSFLTINGKNAAGYLCFDYANKIWVYNSGFSPGHSYYSPGWVLLGYLIQLASNNGKTHFDFMRGDEKYKYRFGAKDSFVMKSVITQKST